MNTLRLVIFLFSFALPLSSLYAQLPSIPAGPDGVIYSCEEGEDDFGCFGILLDSDGFETRFNRARRTLRRQIRRTRRQRRVALRSGNAPLAAELLADVVLLRSIRSSSRQCLRYDDPFCEGGSGGGSGNGGSNGGGSGSGSNNSAVAEACDALGNTPSSDRVVLRIVNGAICERGDSPIVPVLNDGGLHCTGSVVASNVVVTAAHCVVDFNCSSLSVSTGTGVTRGASSCISHPSYDGRSEDHDVALLILDGNLDTRTMKIHTSKDITVGERVSFAGYGRNEDDDSNLRATFNFLTSVTEGSLVVEYSQGQENIGNSCNGDSGGPLAIVRNNEWVLIGAVSNGDAEDCALPGTKERSDVSRWANLTSTSNQAFIRDNTSGILD